MEKELDIVDTTKEQPVPYVPMEFPGNGQSKYNNPFPEGVPAFIYQDHAQPQYTFPESRSAGQFIKPDTKAPGFFENFGHNWWKYNQLAQAGEFVVNSFSPNHLKEDVPDGWKVTPDDLMGFSENYWGTLIDATGPNDLAATKEAIKKEMQEDEYFSNGSWASALLGGISGGAMSPGSIFTMKYLTSFKYANVSKTVLMNAMNVVPAVALDSFATESLIEANRVAPQLENIAFNTVTDTVFGSALMGIGAGMGKLNHDLKLWDTRKAFSLYTQKGIKIDPIIDSKGKLTGEASFTSAPGESLSAAEVDMAKQWYTENMSKSGAYAIPGLGSFLEKTSNIPGLRSPAAQSAFNRFTSVKRWYNGIAGSPFITQGESEGIASASSAQIAALRYSAQAHDFTVFYKNQFMKANGINGESASAKLKNFAQGISMNRQITHQDFGKEVLSILSEKTYKSQYSEAHAVADEMHNIFVEMNELISKHTGRPMFKDPRNAWRYFPIKDNVSEMVNRRDAWEKLTSNLIKEQDDRIEATLLPINNSKARIDSLKKMIKSLPKDDRAVRDYKNQLKAAKKLLKKQEDEHHDRILNNPDYQILLEEGNRLLSQERDALRKLLEPIKKAKTLKERDALIRELEDKAYSGEIDTKFYFEDGYGIKFHDPDKHPKLRKPYASDRERTMAVKALWESKMHMSPNDIMSSVFGQISPSVGMPNHFKRRTNLVPVSQYVAEGFQDTDLASLMTGYLQVVGKDLGFKEAFPEFANSRDFEGVFKGLKQEYDKESARILSQPETPARRKETMKLQKDFDNARKFMKDTYDAYFNIRSHDIPDELRDTITVLKNVTSAALMGGVVTYQLQEIGASMMKHGIVNTLSAGLKPMIQSFFELLTKEKGERLELAKNNAAHAGLAVNTALNGLAMKWYNPGVLDQPPGNAALSMMVTGSNKLAHYSMNFFGVNWIANLNERLAASTFQSRAMKAMHDFKNGTISKSEIEAMAHYGLDVKRDSDMFLKLMEEAGGYQEGRAFQSMYWKWSDNEAMIKMGDSIRRAVRDTVVNSDAFASPYWTRNPLISLIFMYHGWAYNAFNRYAVPLMQRPHAESVLGATAMVGLSMLSQPLQRFANGKDFFKDDESWLESTMRGVDYSGLLGPNWDALSNLNKFLGDPLYASSEKRSGYNRQGALFGPVFGTFYGVADAMAHGAKGDATKGDLRRFSRIIAGRSHVALRQIFDYFIDNSGLPDKRQKN